MGSVPVEPSESLKDFSVLKLALDRRLRSLKNGIVAAETISGCSNGIEVVSGSSRSSRRGGGIELRHDKQNWREHVVSTE